MCGIAGILRVWQPGDAPPAHTDAIPEAWLDILDESIKHRGPDGRGRFRQRVVRGDGSVVDVALVHRRLSIIDHADGAQPMLIGDCATGGSPASAAPLAMIAREGAPYAQLPTAADHHTCPKCGDGVVAVVFNGCIYNHRELRRELEAAGHVFHTDHSDTEVLLHGWREWGEEISGKLESMYAYAIWDSAEDSRRVCFDEFFLDRDAAGQKPLYSFDALHDGSTGVKAFCSSWTGLYHLASQFDPRGERELCPNRRLVRHWVRFGYGETPVRTIRQLSPPYMENPTVQRLRSPAHRPTNFPRPLDVESALDRAVGRHLEADVPVGCFLSGGVDSSLIAALAHRQHSDILALTVRMPDPRYDESPHARRVAQHLGMRHIEVDVSPEPAPDLVKLIQQLGLPFGDSSLLPAYWISVAAKGAVLAALSGEGADELFGGYQRYRATDILLRHRWWLRALPPGLFPQRDPRRVSTKLARLVSAAVSGNANDLAAIFPTSDIQDLWPARPDRPIHPSFRPTGARMRQSDLTGYLPEDLLRKVDTASMAVGLEVRAPMLDGELIQTVTAIPFHALCPNGQRKGLLRALARRYLPPDIVDRPKMGFAIPIGEWFRTDYGGMRQLLYDHLEAADPFPGLAEAGVELNRDFIRRMLREHDAAGERSINPWHGRDHSQRLYMLLVLSIWCRWLRRL